MIPPEKPRGVPNGDLTAKRSFTTQWVASVPCHHTLEHVLIKLEHVLIKIPGVHCPKLGAASLFRSPAQESIVYLVNWADSSDQIFR